MKAKYVYESVDFERGQDPREVLRGSKYASFDHFVQEFEEIWDYDFDDLRIDEKAHTITYVASDRMWDIIMVFDFDDMSLASDFEVRPEEEGELERMIERGDASRYDYGGTYGDTVSIENAEELAGFFEDPDALKM